LHYFNRSFFLVPLSFFIAPHSFPFLPSRRIVDLLMRRCAILKGAKEIKRKGERMVGTRPIMSDGRRGVTVISLMDERRERRD